MNFQINDKIFHASYNIGPKEEQIKELNPILDIFITTIIRPLKTWVYTGASFLREQYIDYNPRNGSWRRQIDAIF